MRNKVKEAREQIRFDAIVARNNIAKELAEYKQTGELSISWVLSNLYDIELYTGTMNQPTVDDSYEEAL